jgi:hypothetical protein
MPAITPSRPVLSGVAPTSAAAGAGGDTVANPRGNTILRVNNGGGASINVTIAAGANPSRPADGTFPAMTLGNQVVAVPAGAVRLIGPVPSAYNDAAGNINLSYSAVTSVTVEAIHPDA